MDLTEKFKIKNKNNVFKLISVGRAHWKKGYTYALDACRLLKDSGFSFEYVIVGGANSIEYQYQIQDLGIDDDVVLLEYQDFTNIQDLIQEADLLLFCSVEEQSANVVLDAMTFGILVLSTTLDSVKGMIEDGYNGFLVPLRDAKAMADRVQHIEKLTKTEKQSILQEAQNSILKR